jgi:hypothetical protein
MNLTEQQDASSARRFDFILRQGLWLVSLLASITLPVVYFSRPFAPVTPGLTSILGWGSLLGVIAGLGAAAFYVPLMRRQSTIGRIGYWLTSAMMGAFAGWAALGLLNDRGGTPLGDVELPIARVEQAGDQFSIYTMLPSSPSNIMRISSTEIIGLPVAGQCLFGRLRRGLLDRKWLSRLSVTSCSAKRGEAGTNVLMPINRWMDWRWHKPRSFRLDGSHQAYDEALPQSATCRTERESWLYQCFPKGAGRRRRQSVMSLRDIYR